MQSPDDKNAIAYFSALALLFSYAEAALPRIIPFFRLGLANTAMILALRSEKIAFLPFIKLSLVKAFASSLTSGTLFTPFFLVSIAQSVSSAMAMYFLSSANKKLSRKFVSAYGISVFGSAVSATVQTALCSLYLGKGTFNLLGPILIFNTISGIATALLSGKISAEIPKENATQTENARSEEKHEGRNFLKAAVFSIGAIFAAAAFLIEDIRLLFALFFSAFVMQKMSKRKILSLPLVFMWIFIFASTVPFPSGEIVISFFDFDITKGALKNALQKSLRLSTVSAVSQCAVAFIQPSSSILSLALFHYKTMSDRFRNADGNILFKLKITLANGQQ